MTSDCLPHQVKISMVRTKDDCPIQPVQMKSVIISGLGDTRSVPAPSVPTPSVPARTAPSDMAPLPAAKDEAHWFRRLLQCFKS